MGLCQHEEMERCFQLCTVGGLSCLIKRPHHLQASKALRQSPAISRPVCRPCMRAAGGFAQPEGLLGCLFALPLRPSVCEEDL